MADERMPLIQREGASLRTADELVLQFVEDALTIDPHVLSPYGQDVLRRCKAGLRNGWFRYGDLNTAAQHLAHQVESDLADHVVIWEDGYTIWTYDDAMASGMVEDY